MAEAAGLICAASALVERGSGVRFQIGTPEGPLDAFVVRFLGQVHGYVNRCAHARVELDWPSGEFFDLSGQYLLCKTHGAAYRPESGVCVIGPCKGARLVQVKVQEINGQVFLMDGKEAIHV